MKWPGAAPCQCHSPAGPRVGQAGTRQQTQAFWSLATFLLNGALFVLVGLELQTAVHGLTGGALTQGLIAVIAVLSAGNHAPARPGRTQTWRTAGMLLRDRRTGGT